MHFNDKISTAFGSLSIASAPRIDGLHLHLHLHLHLCRQPALLAFREEDNHPPQLANQNLGLFVQSL